MGWYPQTWTGTFVLGVLGALPLPAQCRLGSLSPATRGLSRCTCWSCYCRYCPWWCCTCWCCSCRRSLPPVGPESTLARALQLPGKHHLPGKCPRQVPGNWLLALTGGRDCPWWCCTAGPAPAGTAPRGAALDGAAAAGTAPGGAALDGAAPAGTAPGGAALLVLHLLALPLVVLHLMVLQVPALPLMVPPPLLHTPLFERLIDDDDA